MGAALREAASLLGLRLGSVVEARLQEALGPREGVLSIGGNLFRALHPEGLSPGQRLELRLVSLGPPPVFKLPGGPDDAVARLLRPPSLGFEGAVRAFLTAPPAEGAPGADLAAALGRLLRLPEEPAALAAALARLLRGSGLFHEADLARPQTQSPADLKALALLLLSRQPEGALARAAAALVGHVEAHQARSLLEGAAVVPLVLPWGEEWVHGELRLELEGRRAAESGKAGGALRLRLQMPRLGPVEVNVRWGSPGVFVRLALEPPVLEEAREGLEDLSRLLTRDAGVRVADLRAEPLPPPAPKGSPGLVEVLA
ncbi:MAG: hypothetical protein AB1578_11965 [Thermodesulfobacteriota bacterium]